MTIANCLRRISGRLVAKWALFAAVSAGVLAGPLLIPALWQAPLAAVVAVLGAMVSGATVGAVAAVLFQVAGRSRFWVLAMGLNVACLAYVAAAREITRNGTLLLWAGLTIAIALCLWHLLAYGLYTLRRQHHR